MKRHNRIICIISALVAVLAAMLFVVACDDEPGEKLPKKYTLTFVTDNGTVIDPIVEEAGKAITPPADPKKPGYDFEGWYKTADFSGNKFYIPTVMPAENITYYANFVNHDTSVKIVYDINLSASHSGEVEDTVGEPGDDAVIKDGAAYNVSGYRFLGWSTKKYGPITFSDQKADGQYDVGDEVKLGATNLTLYAQWAKEYTDAREKSADKIYVYDALIGKGFGAAILARNGKPDKLGFVKSGEDTATGDPEFEFYFDESEGGNVVGRLYGNGTYACIDNDEAGVFLFYDHVSDDAGLYVLALDGYEYAVISEMVGSQIVVRYYGYYAFDERYNDYVFEYLTNDTGTAGETTFVIERCEIDDTEFDGYFRMIGYESGEFLLYDNGELLNLKLSLNGYGSALVYEYDPIDDVTELVATGAYRGTENYEDYYGEWEFVPAPSSSIGSFKFILNEIIGSSNNISIYIEHNSDYDVTLDAQDGSGTLTMDGYGYGLYECGGVSYMGSVIITDANIKLAVGYIDNAPVDDGDTLYFTANFEQNTFKLNEDGFIIDDDGVLLEYAGKSKVIVIPDGVTAIADDAFNYVRTENGVSIVSVIVPASVTSIGARAFENENTLRRVIFLSETPVDIDFTSETAVQTDPFRWPAGSFIIVVPEGSQEDYIAAWGSKYTIKGSVEVTLLPEFEIVDGVLVRYNKPDDSGDELSIVIPDEVVEIADKVFSGADYIVSVDLKNVVKIGDDAFEGCVNLTHVLMPKVEQIGDGAFAGCYSLVSSGDDDVIYLPAIKTIGASAFRTCYSLRRVVMGEGLTEIGDLAFYESQVFETDPPLFIELEGTTVPEMGEKIFVGCIAVRIQVNDIDVAFECYNDGSWTAYCTHLYVKSGDEAGKYMSGSILLNLDGRAELQGTVVMLYEIDGTTITFYEYSRETATFATIVGAIEGGVIIFTRDGSDYEFYKADGEFSYISADGLYTLVCDPLALDPEYYDGYSGTAPAKLNGVDVTIKVSGYNVKILGFVDTDGKRYDLTPTFGKGKSFTYTIAPSAYYLYDVTSADGSNLTLHFTANAIYVYGTLNQKIEDTDRPVFSSELDYSYSLIKVSDNVYTFTCMYLNDRYTVTLTFADGDMTSFTYTCEKQ